MHRIKRESSRAEIGREEKRQRNSEEKVISFRKRSSYSRKKQIVFVRPTRGQKQTGNFQLIQEIQSFREA